MLASGNARPVARAASFGVVANIVGSLALAAPVGLAGTAFASLVGIIVTAGVLRKQSSSSESFTYVTRPLVAIALVTGSGLALTAVGVRTGFRADVAFIAAGIAPSLILWRVVRHRFRRTASALGIVL